jgi:hypothetical protein
MNKLMGIAMVLGATAFSPLFGQQGKEALWPGGMALQQAPEWAKWEISLVYIKQTLPSQYAASAAAVNDTREKLGAITVTKTANLRHQDLVWNNGQKMSLWSKGSTFYMMNQGDPPISIPSDVAVSMHPAVVSGDEDFADMDWVSEKYFTGIQTLGGAKCLIFQRNLETVLVDLATRLPMKWTNGKETRNYKFLVSPEEKLEWPEEILSAEDMKKKVDANKNRRAPRGG